MSLVRAAPRLCTISPSRLKTSPGISSKRRSSRCSHDLDDRLLALADGDEVEMVDESLRLARRVGATDHGQCLAADLLPPARGPRPAS